MGVAVRSACARSLAAKLGAPKPLERIVPTASAAIDRARLLSFPTFTIVSPLDSIAFRRPGNRMGSRRPWHPAARNHPKG